MKKNYENYFKEHYKSSFSENDVHNYREWFTCQWDFLKAKVGNLGHGEILEVGSGIGGLYSFLNCDTCSYTGLELDKTAVEFSTNFFKKTAFLNQCFEEFSSEKKFNQVFAFEVLEHLENPISSIEKIAGILRKNGIFIGSSPYPYKKNILADKTHNFVLHPENWKRLFLNCGFNSVEIFPFSCFPFLWRIHKNLNIRLPFYTFFPSFISTSLIVAKMHG